MQKIKHSQVLEVHKYNYYIQSTRSDELSVVPIVGRPLQGERGGGKI